MEVEGRDKEAGLDPEIDPERLETGTGAGEEIGEEMEPGIGERSE